MSRMAEARARHALGSAGLDASVGLAPLSSVTNEVWLAEDHVVRINRRPVPRLRREAELAAVLPPEVGAPNVVAYGGIVGADWMVTERLPGQVLSRCWPAMNRMARRRAIGRLAVRLHHLHRFVLDAKLPEIEFPHLLTSARSAPPGEAVVEALRLVRQLPHVDVTMMDAAIELVELTASALDPFDASTCVHGDLHFENVMWDGEDITGVLDFEFARTAPADLELDVLLRYCAFPHLHVAEDYEHLTHPEDYGEVVWWLADDYPQLFAVPNLADRMRLYSLAFDVRDLLLHPPPGPVDGLAHLHPYHRIASLLDGTSHIDRLADTPLAA